MQLGGRVQVDTDQQKCNRCMHLHAGYTHATSRQLPVLWDNFNRKVHSSEEAQTHNPIPPRLKENLSRCRCACFGGCQLHMQQPTGPPERAVACFRDLVTQAAEQLMLWEGCTLGPVVCKYAITANVAHMWQACGICSKKSHAWPEYLSGP